MSFKRYLRSTAVLLALSFTSSQVFAFTPSVLPLTNASLSRSFVPIQNLQTTKDSRGLESLGVNPQMAGFIGNLTAGAIIGAFEPETMAGAHVAISQAQNIQSSMQQVITLNQVGRLGMELGLDPLFSSIIGLSLGAIQGHLIQNPGSNLELAFNSIKPDLFNSFSKYGFEKLSASLNMNPYLSQTLEPLVIQKAYAMGQSAVGSLKEVPTSIPIKVDPEKKYPEIYIPGPGQDPSALQKFVQFLAQNGPALLTVGKAVYKVFAQEGVAHAAEISLSVGELATGQLIDVVLLGGFSLFKTSPAGTLPDYFKLGSPFLDKLNDVGVNPSSVKVVPLFEESWLDANQFVFLKSEAQKIIKAMRQIKDNQSEKNFVPMAYSGAGHALLSAISSDTRDAQDGFGIKTAILVGAPMPRTSVHHGSLERIINIYGSEDMFLTGTPPIAKRFTHDQHSLETINIELQGVKHNDKDSYFYSDEKTATEIQKKASNFIARLTQAALDKNPGDLSDFFDRLERRVGSPVSQHYTDPTTHIMHKIKTYKVDWSKLPENF